MGVLEFGTRIRFEESDSDLHVDLHSYHHVEVSDMMLHKEMAAETELMLFTEDTWEHHEGFANRPNKLVCITVGHVLLHKHQRKHYSDEDSVVLARNVDFNHRQRRLVVRSYEGSNRTNDVVLSSTVNWKFSYGQTSQPARGLDYFAQDILASAVSVTAENEDAEIGRAHV